MKITTRFLNDRNACQEGMQWVSDNKLIGMEALPFIDSLMCGDKLDWASWLIVRVMSYKQYVSYAVFSAEQVIDIYEKQYPDDKCPRNAIEAAKKCIDNPNAKNKKAAYADAAAYAASTADSADAAAYAAAYAAGSAADAAASIAAAAYAADAAAYAAAYAVKKEMKIKILKYGIKLLS
jgi:K+-transporting ATPase c subunit